MLRHYVLELLAAKRQAPDALPVESGPAPGVPASTPGGGAAAGAQGGGPSSLRRLDKGPIEACLCVVVLALSVVMAGSGVEGPTGWMGEQRCTWSVWEG